MTHILSRRRFLKGAAAAGAAVGVGDFAFLGRLPLVSAAEARLEPDAVRLRPEIEPLVRVLEETPRARLLEEIAHRVRHGLSYRDLLAALLLAGVKNIQPRPVGFKFHAVLVVNSAHLASISAPDSDRWLPVFWALDYFKSSQARDIREGNWTMTGVDEARVPPGHRARERFVEAMDNWDVAAADPAVAGLARSAGAQEVFEVFCRYGVRDFRDIGHKAIYVANAWRTLQCIGWQHAEPVLRSLAYGLLDHEGENPARRDAQADRPWRHNQELAARVRRDWLDGRPNGRAVLEMLAVLREASYEEASEKVVELLNDGVAASSIWDALFQAAGEQLMRRPGIVSLHAVTSTNAIYYAFQHTANDETRRLLLLQNAAFLPLFRGRQRDDGIAIDQVEPLRPGGKGSEAVEEIFAAIDSDRMSAARKLLGFLEENPDAREVIDTARRLIFLKGTNSHDYKFSSAVLEDFYHVSPEWRDRFLAASVFNLRGSGASDTALARRIREALAG